MSLDTLTQNFDAHPGVWAFGLPVHINYAKLARVHPFDTFGRAGFSAPLQVKRYLGWLEFARGCSQHLPEHRPSAAGPSPLFLLAILLLTASCGPATKRVTLTVDGNTRTAQTRVITVQDFLTEQKITLGDNDRVEPPTFTELSNNATVTITRVEFKIETVRQPIPFERKLVRDEGYPERQMRVLQLGANGIVEITYTTVFEDRQEISRSETARKILSQPKPEILAVGTQGSLPVTALAGSIVYLANGNAWVMRNSSSDKRPLTSAGDLDGRVFSLSGDGRYLLFSRAADPSSYDLNSIWVIDTLVLGETARALPISNLVYAQLAADTRFVVYSTGIKTAGAPGWKAQNDLWYAPLTAADLSGAAPLTLKARKIWEPSQPGAYSWWGGNFALSPDGRAVAYALANEIGFTEISSRTNDASMPSVPRQIIRNFAPFRTLADWVWVPRVAWSPDSRFILAAVHSPLDAANVATDNPTFELWVSGRDGTVSAPLAKQTGMWASPAWSPPNARGESQIAFGVALSPSDSERSRYALYIMDRDGGNKRQIFPLGTEDGLLVVQVAWASGGQQLVAVREGDVWLYDLPAGRWSQLTANGATDLVRWGR